MTTTSFSYPSCSVCWFPRFTSASSFIPHGQAAKSSVAFLVRLQTVCNEVALTFSPLRTKGDLGWHAWCQPRMFPDLFVFPPLYVILRASMWIRSHRARYRCTRPRHVCHAHTCWSRRGSCLA